MDSLAPVHNASSAWPHQRFLWGRSVVGLYECGREADGMTPEAGTADVVRGHAALFAPAHVLKLFAAHIRLLSRSPQNEEPEGTDALVISSGSTGGPNRGVCPAPS